MEETGTKPKSEGVKHCCYGTCNSDTRYRHRDDMKDVFFIPFPKPITKREMCERWIKACGRPLHDFNVQKIKRCTYMQQALCGGKGPTSEHPDPIPALLHTDEQVRRFERKRKAPTPRSKPLKASRADVRLAAESLLQLSTQEPLQPAVVYRVGQLFMIAKHSHEQSQQGEGVEVVKNEPIEDQEHGKGQFTEKRIHLSSKLPYWIRSMIPQIFYITEKAWNYYPFTKTEYTCSFIPKFSIQICTRYEDNPGTTENCLRLNEEELSQREVDFIDIVNDPIEERHYKEEEDLTKFKSEKTGRGPLGKDWRETTKPVMCSYKVVRCFFEVWGLQSRVESYAQRVCRDINLLGHRQAISWMDDWIDMSMDDIRNYENKMQKETNEKVLLADGLEDKTEETTANVQ